MVARLLQLLVRALAILGTSVEIRAQKRPVVRLIRQKVHSVEVHEAVWSPTIHWFFLPNPNETCSGPDFALGLCRVRRVAIVLSA